MGIASWESSHLVKILGFFKFETVHVIVFLQFNRKHCNTGFLSSGVSLTSWGEGTLVLVGPLSSDGVTIKIPYGVDVLLH